MKTQLRHLFLRHLRKGVFFINRFDDTKKTRSTKNGRLVCFKKKMKIRNTNTRRQSVSRSIGISNERLLLEALYSVVKRGPEHDVVDGHAVDQVLAGIFA